MVSNPSRLHDEIKKIYITQHKEGQLIFSPSINGIVSTQKDVTLMRERGVDRIWSRWVWQYILPPNISAFLRKVVKHAVPVDSPVRAKGISLVPGCRCYINSSQESIIFTYLFTRMAGRSSSSQYDMCRIGIAAYIFREVWVARCQATYEDIPIYSRNICLKVVLRVQSLNLIHNPK